MTPAAKVYVAGHRGLVGSALMRRLQSGGYGRLVTRTRTELDLTNQQAVQAFFRNERPEYVFLAAAKVGGIGANSTYPADFIYLNLMIQTNVIHAAYETGVKKLLFLGSSCIYPKHAPQPMKEEYLLTGALEPTNEPYAVAKIAGIKMCAAYNRQYGTDFMAVMPTNVYGPGDNYDLESSHVIPALIRRFHEARVQSGLNSAPSRVVVWGTGAPRREFLYSEDLADACVFLMERATASDMGEFINIGTGQEHSIEETAQLVSEVVGFRGEIVFDPAKPDGIPRKLLDVSRLRALGWTARTDLRAGLALTVQDYLANSAKCMVASC